MAGSDFTLSLSPRLFLAGKKCFGPGIAELLEGIEREGNLRSVTVTMGMSYSNAWNTLKSCEEALGFPLSQRQAGGPKGGNSTLTPKGRALLEGYRRIEARLREEQGALLAEINLPEEDEHA